MPNIKSAKKRVRVTKAKALENQMQKNSLRTMIKKAELALATNAEDKEAVVRLACKKIDQASAKGLLHKNCAARKKSSLASKLVKAG